MFDLPRKHTVVFKGSLKKYGSFEIAGYTVAECVRGIAVQIPELYTKIKNGNFKVRRINKQGREYFTEEMATKCILSKEYSQTIEIVPAIIGATGDNNSDMIIAGTSLLVVGIIVGALSFGAGSVIATGIGSTAATIFGNIATSMATTGLSLVFSGVAGLLASQDDKKEDEETYAFSGATNISKQGVSIPLIYGRVGVGSNVVSNRIGNIYGSPEMPAGEYSSGTNSTVRLTDLLGEGEIVGLENGLKSILFDGVPLENKEGTLSFPNTVVTFCTGVNNVEDPYSDGANTPFAVGATFENDVWQTFTVTDANVDRININVKFSSLYYQDKDDGHKDFVSTYFYVEIAGEELIWQPAIFTNAYEQIEYAVVEKTIYPILDENSYGYRFEGGGHSSIVEYGDLWYEWRDENNVLQREYVGYFEETTSTTFGFNYLNNIRKNLPKTVKCMETVSENNILTDDGFIIIRAYTTASLDLTLQINISNLDRSKARYFRIKQHKTYTDPSNGVQDCQLVAYSEQINVKMNYEGRALAYVSLNAKDFKGTLPNRIYVVKGLIIDVPSNYDPENRTYSGIWDGTFKKAWTNNPVWVFYDLLTNSRYGLGRSIAKENIDKWSLYYASIYCDELVDDGKGGKEPRFTFNGVINSREDAFSVLENVAGVFRAMIYGDNGVIFVGQDTPKDVKRTFGNSNVVGGMFNYEGSAATARHTAVEVTWINPDNTWQSEVELYEDAELIQRYGYNVKSVTATGCTSRGQAIRIAKHTIYTEEYENDTVTFQVGLMDSDLRPSDVIYIQDEMIAGEVLQGMIKEISTQTIVVDTPIRMSLGVNYSIILTNTQGKTYKKNLVNREMETDTLWIRSDEYFTQEQLEDFKYACTWLVISDNVMPRKFKVIGITEDGENGGGVYTVTALLHYDEKYAYIDESIKFELPPISSQPDGELQPPTVFQAKQYLSKVEGVVVTGADCSWGMPSDSRVSAVEVKLSYPNSNGYVDYGLLYDNSLKIDNTGVGQMRAKLRSYSNITGTYSKEVTFIIQLETPYYNPPMPINLTAESVSGVGIFKWEKPPYAFDLTYEYYFISPSGQDTPIITTNNGCSISRSFDRYPATVELYVRSINEVGMMSDYAKITLEVTQAQSDIGSIIGNIDDSWLTEDTQQLLGADGIYEQIANAMCNLESYTIRRQDKTDSELAFAVDGLSALTEDHTALATKFTSLGAFVGGQLTSDDPTKFNLKWYDGSDPEYPKTPNPYYDDKKDVSIENYPYLPAYPKNSLAGQITQVYAGDDFVKAQMTNDLRVEFDGVTSEIKENMVTTVNDKGEAQSNYSIILAGKNKEGKPIIGGFGLTSDGTNAEFGVDATKFWIRDPNWQEGDNPYDEFVFVTDTQSNETFIGTSQTIFKGKVQSLSYLENNQQGFSLDPTTNTFELNSEKLRFKIDNDSIATWSRLYSKENKFLPIVKIGEDIATGGRPDEMVEAPNQSILRVDTQYYDWENNMDDSSKNGIKVVSMSGNCYTSLGGDIAFNDETNSLSYAAISYGQYNRNDIQINTFTKNHITLHFSGMGVISDDLFLRNNDINSVSRLVTETMSYFVLKTLNDMVNMPTGSLISLPNPLCLLQVDGNNTVYNMNYTLPTDLWYKELPAKNNDVEYHNNYPLVAQPQKLFYNGTIANVRTSYENISAFFIPQSGLKCDRYLNFQGKVNNFYFMLPLRFAGWKRLSCAVDSYGTAQLVSDIHIWRPNPEVWTGNSDGEPPIPITF